MTNMLDVQKYYTEWCLVIESLKKKRPLHRNLQEDCHSTQTELWYHYHQLLERTSLLSKNTISHSTSQSSLFILLQLMRT